MPDEADSFRDRLREAFIKEGYVLTDRNTYYKLKKGQKPPSRKNSRPAKPFIAQCAEYRVMTTEELEELNAATVRRAVTPVKDAAEPKLTGRQLAHKKMEDWLQQKEAILRTKQSVKA